MPTCPLFLFLVEHHQHPARDAESAAILRFVFGNGDTLDVALVGHRDDYVLFYDQVFDVDVAGVVAEFASSRHAVGVVDLGQFVAMHHPFTAPLDECLEYLETDKAKVRAKAYDLVLNGIELSSGSIRITNPELQGRIFTLLGLTDEQAHEKFGYLLDAFRYGAPPHGGMGIGLDRLIMQMLGCESLRDVIAFPKVQNASEPMTDCPAPVDEVQLTDLGIAVAEQKSAE